MAMYGNKYKLFEHCVYCHSRPCAVIWNELKEEEFPLLTEERLAAIRDGFWDDWQYPNCLGAIDGRHCVVQNFPNEGGEYFNYKGSFSMVLLGICDSRYRFTYVDIGARGRRHDAGVWERCSFREAMVSGELPIPPPKLLPGGWEATPHHLVADDAFPLGPHTMKPYEGHFLPNAHAIFNYR
ncbi:Protein ALP1-like [Frankliniella fusca]|uniref:Protein ALP1-like n=1 Tax=Frankliniella fusca TaxID=407009 RepID=A0AAE1LXG3_9NEOP|nr:Protein ALP1-like [Frankliniella fusca]